MAESCMHRLGKSNTHAIKKKTRFIIHIRVQYPVELNFIAKCYTILKVELM